jgi:hypothetical protein
MCIPSQPEVKEEFSEQRKSFRALAAMIACGLPTIQELSNSPKVKRLSEISASPGR